MLAAYIGLLVLLQLLGWFERRYAIDINHNEAMLPVHRWCTWGRLVDQREPSWYCVIRLPSWSYEYSPAWDEYRMMQRSLLYITGRGWRIWYLP